MALQYPTMDQVTDATHIEICKWYLLLKSPINDDQANILAVIGDRLAVGGGITPEISNQIRWGVRCPVSEPDYTKQMKQWRSK
jgi:hypothetical protein